MALQRTRGLSAAQFLPFAGRGSAAQALAGGRSPLNAVALGVAGQSRALVGLLAVLGLCFFASCIGSGATMPAQPQKDGVGSSFAEPTVNLTGPYVVGFFPPFTQQQIESEEGAEEALSHLEFAVSDTVKCLKAAGLPVEARIVLARSIVVVQGGSSKRLELPSAWPEAVGAYLLSPRKPPLIVHAQAGPSSLTTLVPEAAAAFFDAATCHPLEPATRNQKGGA